MPTQERQACYLRQHLCLILFLLTAAMTTGHAYSMSIAVAPLTSPATKQASLAGESSTAYTWQRLVTVSEQADALETATLVSVISATDGSQVVALQWLKDTSDWWPTWYLGFTGSLVETTGAELGSVAQPTVAQPAKVSPVSGHTYQVTFSWDFQNGAAAAEVVDKTTGKTIYTQGLQIKPYRGKWMIGDRPDGMASPYAFEDIAYFDCFLPVNVNWQLETRTNGGKTFISASSMERQDDLAIHTWSAGYTPNGSYRLLLEHGDQQIELSRLESDGDRSQILKGTQLPLGKSSIVIQYEKDGRVLLSERQDICIGSALIEYLPVKTNTVTKTMQGTLRIRSHSAVEDLPIKVQAELYKMTWDEINRIYKSEALGSRLVFDGAIDLAAEKAADIPLVMELPEGNGMWKIEFKEIIGADIKLTRSKAARLFSVYPTASVAPGQPFTIAVLGDTQNYTELYPDVLTRATEWIAANAQAKNIVAVLQMGDVTNHNVTMEWENAQTSMSVLQGVVPYVMAVGNHDVLANGDWAPITHSTTNISRFFPPQSFSALHGTFEPGEVANSFYEFSFAGSKYLIMSLEYLPRDTVLDWANQVIDSYPNHKVIIVTHEYTYTRGDLATIDREGEIPDVLVRFLANESTNDGGQMWDKLIRKHANITMVFSGHFASTSIPWGIYKGDHGNNVYNFMVGNSDQPNGGDGWIALFEIYPDGTFKVNYYSPYLAHAAEPSVLFLGGVIYH